MNKLDWRSRIYENYKSTHLDAVQKTGSYNLERLKMIFQKYLPDERAHIVDLGCGKGQLIEALAELGYKDSIGVDYSVENTEYCAGKGLDVINANVFDFVGEKDSRQFDCVILFDIIEHLYPDELINLFDRINDRLSDNGILMIKTINAANVLDSFDRFMDLSHVISFTEYSLSQLGKISGFPGFSVWREPVFTLRSRLRMMLSRMVHVMLYRINGGKVPEHTEREFVCVFSK